MNPQERLDYLIDLNNYLKGTGFEGTLDEFLEDWYDNAYEMGRSDALEASQ